MKAVVQWFEYLGEESKGIAHLCTWNEVISSSKETAIDRAEIQLPRDDRSGFHVPADLESDEEGRFLYWTTREIGTVDSGKTYASLWRISVPSCRMRMVTLKPTPVYGSASANPEEGQYVGRASYLSINHRESHLFWLSQTTFPGRVKCYRGNLNDMNQEPLEIWKSDSNRKFFPGGVAVLPVSGEADGITSRVYLAVADDRESEVWRVDVKMDGTVWETKRIHVESVRDNPPITDLEIVVAEGPAIKRRQSVGRLYCIKPGSQFDGLFYEDLYNRDIEGRTMSGPLKYSKGEHVGRFAIAHEHFYLADFSDSPKIRRMLLRDTLGEELNPESLGNIQCKYLASGIAARAIATR